MYSMISVSNEQFQELINVALTELPGEHVTSIKNIAILFDQLPSQEQRQRLKLRDNQTLLGLYEGVPLTQRQGMNTALPDRITLYKIPICSRVDSLPRLKEQIKHTLWHEIGHYYGLNHDDIARLE
jgi:predicted Zn-dependent protease with MMP-like domain